MAGGTITDDPAIREARDLVSDGSAVARRTHEAPDPLPAALAARDPKFIRSVAHPFCSWLRDSYFRTEVIDADLMPQRPFIAVTNHGGGPMLPDMWPMLAEFWDRSDIEQPSYALVHDAAFRVPVVAGALARLGAVPASRANAEAVVARGGTLLIAPGGDAEATRSFRERNRIDLRGRSFFVELALRHGVPIIPVVTIGGHEAYVTVLSSERLARVTGLRRAMRISRVPINLGLPWGIWATGLVPYLPLPTKITYRALEPIDVPHAPDLAGNPHVVREIFADVERRMQAAIADLAARRRWPVIG